MLSKTKGSKTRFQFLLKCRKMSKTGWFTHFKKHAQIIM